VINLVEWHNGYRVVQRGVAGGPSLYTTMFDKSTRELYQYKFYGKIKFLLVSDSVKEFIGPLQITSLNFGNDSITKEKLLIEHGRKSCPKSPP